MDGRIVHDPERRRVSEKVDQIARAHIAEHAQMERQLLAPPRIVDGHAVPKVFGQGPVGVAPVATGAHVVQLDGGSHGVVLECDEPRACQQRLLHGKQQRAEIEAVAAHKIKELALAEPHAAAVHAGEHSAEQRPALRPASRPKLRLEARKHKPIQLHHRRGLQQPRCILAKRLITPDDPQLVEKNFQKEWIRTLRARTHMGKLPFYLPMLCKPPKILFGHLKKKS